MKNKKQDHATPFALAAFLTLVCVLTLVAGCFFSELGFGDCVGTHVGPPTPLYIFGMIILFIIIDTVAPVYHDSDQDEN